MCGVDEVGRGPLAGPVVAAAVILDPARPIDGLADSKKLSEKRRETLYETIRERALSWSIGRAEVAEIDPVCGCRPVDDAGAPGRGVAGVMPVNLVSRPPRSSPR